MAGGDHVTAERVLRETIEDTGDTAAVRLYGEVALPDSLVPLDRAESWLRAKPEDPDLLATCARLCLRADLIGKGRSYLEASLARRPSPETSLLLADLLDSIGETSRETDAARCARAPIGRRPSTPKTRLRRRARLSAAPEWPSAPRTAAVRTGREGHHPEAGRPPAGHRRTIGQGACAFQQPIVLTRIPNGAAALPAETGPANPGQ